MACARRRYASGKAGIAAATRAGCDGVLIDARAAAGLKPRLRNGVSIPLPEASKAKDDWRLPMTDHNTRIFVVGSNGAEARAVAEAIVHDAFHNVTVFGGTITDLPELLDKEEGEREK